MLRQALACCLFLIGLIYINKKLIYILLVLLAYTFHRSALLCLIALWADKVYHRKTLYIIIVSSVLMYVVKFDFYYFISSYFYLEDIFANDRISVYLYDREVSYLGLGFWDRLLLLILMNFVYEDLKLKNKLGFRMNLIYNLGIGVLLLQMLLFSSPTITSRARYYFVIFPAIFLTEYINSELKGWFRSFCRFILILYLTLHIYLKATYLI
jgi:hypothetical protein